MSRGELRLLGPVELLGPAGPLRLGGPHQRGIVASLALDAGHTVLTDDLIEGLWGDAAPVHVRKSLSTQVARVRKPLTEVGAALEHTGSGYRLDLPEGCLDLERYERAEREAAELADARLWTRAIARLRDALALWHGAPLSDLGGFPFALAAAGWLVPRRHATEDRLAELLVAAGEPDEAAQLLERLVRDDPYSERRWAQLVRALNAGGRRRDALLAFQRAREQLGEDLGLDPGPELRAVERDVLAGAPGRPAPPEPRRGVAPFIGRTVELDRLLLALDRAGRGGVQAVAVLGEPGIGKSRLLDELAARVRARDLMVLRGACESTRTVPLRCLLSALDPWLADPARAAEIGLDPELLSEDSPPPDPVVGPATLDVRRYRVTTAIGRAITTIARDGPVALLLDDVHWIDPFSAAVLDHLSVEVAHLPVLVVAAASTTAALWPAVDERLVRFERALPLERLTMRPLSDAEVEALVRQQAVGVEDLDGLVRQIQEASGGNALYATQLVAAATTAGRLPASLPEGLEALCRARVARLSPAARDLLDAAAVAGMDSSVALFPAVVDATDDEVVRRASEARAAGLLTEDPDRLRFTHGVVRQVVYADVDEARRCRLHHRVAGALAASTGEPETGRLAAIARHLQRARPVVDDHEVAAALEAAGRQAAQQGALEVAREELQDALALASTDAQRAGIGIALGMVAVADGDLTGVAQIEDGAAQAKTEGRWDLVADAAVARAQLAASPGPRHSRELVEAMEEVLEHLPPDDVTRRGLLHSWRGYLLVNLDPERSAEATATAEALLEEVASPPIEVATRYTRLRQAEARGDDPARCEADALQLADDAEQLGDRSLVSYGHVAAQAARIRGGRFDACRAAQPGYVAASVAGHQHAIELQLVAVDAALAFATGTVDEIDATSRALHRRLTDAAVASADTVRFVQQLFIERERGASPAWEPVLRGVASMPPRGNQPILAAGLLALGDATCAREHLEPWLDRVSEVARDWSHDALVALGAEVVSDLDLGGAPVDQLYEALLPSRGQVVTLTSVVAVLGRVDRYLGRLAHLDRQPELAIEHLDAARRLDDTAGSGLWSGWAARDEAAVRLGRGADGDREAAEELLDLARARARTHGSVRLAAAANRLHPV